MVHMADEENKGSQVQVPSGPDPVAPFHLVWTQPRIALKQLLESQPTASDLNMFLAAYGMAVGLMKAAGSPGMDVQVGKLLFWGLFASLLLFIPYMYLLSWVVAFIGRAMGGRGSGAEIRAAIALASVPQVLTLLLWPAMFVLYGAEPFNIHRPTISARPNPYTIHSVVTTILFFWSGFAMIETIGAAHGLPTRRSIVLWIISGMVTAVIAGALIDVLQIH